MTELTGEDYDRLGRQIWKQFVPPRGQAEFVQGELLRAVAKLRDEAQRNANANFNAGCHALLVEYLRAELPDTSIFDGHTIDQINADLDKVGTKDQPYLDDDIYDRLGERVIDWCMANAAAVPHTYNPELNC